MRADFDLFARQLLKIRSKSGEIMPFVMNKAQRYIHERLEEQFAFFGDRARADWPLRLGSWPVEQNSFLRS